MNNINQKYPIHLGVKVDLSRVEPQSSNHSHKHNHNHSHSRNHNHNHRHNHSHNHDHHGSSHLQNAALTARPGLGMGLLDFSQEAC